MLVSTAYDGQVRLYAVDQQGRLGPPKSAFPGSGVRLYSARFSPDGRRIAVGFADSTVVQVLDAVTLAEVARPNTRGVDNGNLGRVEWSRDGRFLTAAGSWDVGGKSPARRWRVGNWTTFTDVPLARDAVTDLAPLPGGALLFASGDPAWGVIDPAGQVRLRRDAAIADLRGPDRLRLLPDGRQVRFSYVWPGQEARSFDVPNRSLGPDGPTWQAPRISVPGLELEAWEDRLAPMVNGQRIKLKSDERSRSLAIAPDGQRFVLGTAWHVHQFDFTGKVLWSVRSPDEVWAVNISADARFVVAAYGDGTIRWHRFDNGEEVLALFPHADRKRWIAWTPEGFYAASGEDAEGLIGYHLNQGREREGLFISARQLRQHFNQPALVSRRLDADGDALMAEAVAQLGDVRRLLADAAGARVPSVALAPLQETAGEQEVTVTATVQDEGGGIGEVVFYVDGQPQAGRQGGAVAAGRYSRSFALPPGGHRIEVAALNRAGVASARVGQDVTISGPAQDAALHVLAVGVSKYQDPRLELRHGAADAERIAAEIAARAPPLFRRGVAAPVVLTEARASLAGIEAAFGAMKARMRPQDTLVIFLAGHGEAPIGQGYTFLPWDFQRGGPGASGRGLDEARLLRMLAEAPSQTLLLLDTCDAGGAVEMLDGAFERLYGVSRKVLIGASRRGQFAQEGYQGHGVFTAALLRVMQARPGDEDERRLRVVDLRSDVDREVRRIVKALGSASGQTVSGYLGSANFPLLMR